MEKESSGTGGVRVSIFSLLGVLFIALKLCDVIAWSWLWVLAPFWGGFLLVFAIMLVAGIWDRLEYRNIIKGCKKPK